MGKTLIITFAILAIILWIWAVFDITKSRFKNSIMKIVWLLIVLFFPVFGSIFYFQLRKKFVTKKNRDFQPNFNRAELTHN